MIKDYRIYQLATFLTTKYNYKFVNLQGGRENDVYLFNPDIDKYNIIRITADSSETLMFNRQNILNVFNLIADNLTIPRNFLNISVNHEKVDNQELFKCASISDGGYSSGENLSITFDGINNAITKVEDPKTEIKKQMKKINDKAREELMKNINNQRKNNLPIVTIIIASISIALFLVGLLIDGSYTSVEIALGANYHAFVFGLNQYYRLFTSAFLHADLLHLFTNIISLYYLGLMFEKQMDRWKYLLTLLISIFIGSSLWLIFNPNAVSVGLSGGLYGLFAMVIILFYEKGLLFRNFSLMFIIGLNIYLSFTSGVAMMAHLGGAIGGFFAYYLFFKDNVDKTFKQTLTISLLVLLASISIKLFTIKTVQPIYYATDQEVFEIYRGWGLNDYANNKQQQLLEFYAEGTDE